MKNVYDKFYGGNTKMHEAINELIPFIGTQDELQLPREEKYGYHLRSETGYNLYWDATDGSGLDITVWREDEPYVVVWHDFEFDDLQLSNHFADGIEMGEKDEAFETEGGPFPKYPQIAYMGQFKGYSDLMGISKGDQIANEFEREIRKKGRGGKPPKFKN